MHPVLKQIAIQVVVTLIALKIVQLLPASLTMGGGYSEL